MKPRPAALKMVYRCTRPVSRQSVARYVPSGSTLAGAAAEVDALLAAEDEDAHLVALIAEDVERRWAVCADEGRYGGGNHPVVYTAASPAAAVSERCYWAIRNWFQEIPEGNRLSGFVICACSVRGHGRSYMRGWRQNRMLVHPDDYSFCQRLARREARATRYFVVPSARRWRGKCVPVFRKGVIGCRSIVARFDLEWDEAGGRVLRRLRGRQYPVRIDRVYDMVPD